MSATDKSAARKVLWVFLTVALCLTTGAFAMPQVSSLVPGTTKPAPTAPAANAPVDPLGLGRETPRGAIVGFIKMAQDENERAAEYFQPPMKGHLVTAEEEQELAKQLYTVLNATFPASALTSTNADADGRGDDGRARDEITIGGTHLLSESFPVTLVRQEDVHNVKLWFNSRQTLSKVSAAYDSLRWPQLEQKLPQLLVRNRLLSMPLWQWFSIVLFLPVAIALGWAIALAGRVVFGWYRRSRGLQELAPRPLKHFGPGAMLIAVLFHYEFVRQIGTSVLYRLYYRYFLLVVMAIALYWAITRITHWIFRGIALQLTERGRLAERSLLSLVRRVLDVLIFLVIVLGVLSSMDVNVTAALAGLGIGGLAIGLGAQKTFENLLGGISVLTDKAIVVGDPCKIGDRAGTVEDIGLRSTRIRTEERTVVTIPNGTVATATLENFRFRDKILCRQLVRLRYDLSPDHLRYVLAQIREALAKNPKVEASTSRVRILRFGDYAVEVEIYVYILERDWGNYLAAQEALILDVLDTLDRTGGALALPSQATIVTQDAWINPEKAAAAKQAMESGRAPASNRPPSDARRNKV